MNKEETWINAQLDPKPFYISTEIEELEPKIAPSSTTDILD